MKLTRTQIAILCLIFANIIWGASSPIFKWTLQEIQPFTFAFLRFFLSALIILPFTFHRLKINASDIKMLLLIATVGLGFRIGYFIFGLTLSPSINAPIIMSATPVFLIIGSFFLFHERLNKRIINGALLSLIGVLVLVVQPAVEQGFDTSWIGNIFFIITMALGVLYTLILKELSPKYNALTLLFWLFTIASVTLLPFAGVEIARTGISYLFQTQILLGIGFAVFFCTCLGYAMHIYGLRYVKTSEVGLFSYVDPFIAVLIANPLLGEQVTKSFFVGALLVFVGIFIAEGRIHYHPFHLLRRKDPAIEPVRE